MKKILLLLCFLILFNLSLIGAVMAEDGAAVGVTSAESEAVADITPAISVIRMQTKMMKCSLTGLEVAFSETEFQSLFGTTVNFITITQLPDPSAGSLKLNGIDIIEGQTISAEALSQMKFVPSNSSEHETAFVFKTRADGWENTSVSCVLSMKNSRNNAPVFSSSVFNGVEGISVVEKLKISDPDKDDYSINVITYPKNGSVVISSDGRIIYTPVSNFRGSDEMTLRAVDQFGNTSDEATVKFEIGKNSSGLVFTDMSNMSSHLAAIEMCERNIMSYTKSENGYSFNPGEHVNRIDFIVMLVSAMEKDISANNITPVFADISSISAGRVAYLATAISENIVDSGGTLFNPLGALTINEARSFIKNAVGDERFSTMTELAAMSDYTKSLTKAEIAIILRELSAVMN